MSNFESQIAMFNKKYELPYGNTPTRWWCPSQRELIDRLTAFKITILEELDEVNAIITAIEKQQPDVEVLTMIADWLGDIQVYCASEMAKFGLDNTVVLNAIMDSNMSKLAEDGTVIKNRLGKVLKGPNYMRPEPAISNYIRLAMK